MKTFKGGIHPPEFKELARDKAIEKLPEPSRVVLPLIQHLGAPAKPVVNLKEKVIKGQMVAEAEGYVSARIFTPIAGTVVSIGRHPIAGGGFADCIVIEAEEGSEEFQFEPLEDPEPTQIVERVKETGIVGLGGAAFPTHVKLSPPKEFPIDTVIINGAECEPFLNVDYRLMLENAEELIEGALLIRRAVQAKRLIIAVESNKKDAAEHLKNKIKDGIEVVVVPTKYPQGSEKHLIKTVLGREVPSGGLPFHVGVLVQNVQTAIAVKRAVFDGKPLYERVITVSGPSVERPSNFLVSVGMLASEIIEAAGGLKEDTAKVIFGGPMTGIALGRLDVPVVKGTSGITVLPAELASKFDEVDVCIRCGRCIGACPMGLEPYLLGTLGRLGKGEALLEHNIFDCIECGSCAYVCPSKRNLVQLLRLGKIMARETKGQ
jgi:electron transport complex protein RnfC